MLSLVNIDDYGKDQLATQSLITKHQVYHTLSLCTLCLVGRGPHIISLLIPDEGIKEQRADCTTTESVNSVLVFVQVLEGQLEVLEAEVGALGDQVEQAIQNWGLEELSRPYSRISSLNQQLQHQAGLR